MSDPCLAEGLDKLLVPKLAPKSFLARGSGELVSWLAARGHTPRRRPLGAPGFGALAPLLKIKATRCTHCVLYDCLVEFALVLSSTQIYMGL